MTAFTSAALQSFLMDVTWRSAAVVVIVWALATFVSTLSARQRRNLWVTALAVVAAVVVVSAARVMLQLRAGPPPALDAVVRLGTESVALVVPARPLAAPTWQLAMLLGSVAGVLWTLGRVLAAHVRAHRIIRAARLTENRVLLVSLREIAMQLKLRTLPALLQTSDVGTAAVYGMRQHTVLVGADANAWSASRQRHVLAHELAHISQHDPVLAVFARVLRSILWWNPLVALAERRLARERELACDEMVVTGGADACEYAETLLDLSVSSRPVGIGAELSSHGAVLSARIAAVLRFAQVDVGAAAVGTRTWQTSRRWLWPVMCAALTGIAVWPTQFSARRRAPAEIIDMQQVPRGADGRARVWIGFDADGRVSARATTPASPRTH